MIDDSTSQPPHEISIGGVLADARTARGLTVEDVAAATRIRAQLISEIENDRFDGCGGKAYARGHIRAIAHVVGADAEDLVARFDRTHGGPPVERFDPAALPRLSAGTDRDIARAGRSSPRWASAAVAVLAVGAAFLAASWFAGRGGADSRTRAVESPSAPVAPTTAAPTESATPTPTPAVTTPTLPPGVTVQVQVDGGASWVQVRSSTDDVLFARVLDDGETMQWHDAQLLTVRFGNARVVRVSVNGHDLGVPCPRTVCTVQYPVSAAAG